MSPNGFYLVHKEHKAATECNRTDNYRSRIIQYVLQAKMHKCRASYFLNMIRFDKTNKFFFLWCKLRWIHDLYSVQFVYTVLNHTPPSLDPFTVSIRAAVSPISMCRGQNITKSSEIMKLYWLKHYLMSAMSSLILINTMSWWFTVKLKYTVI